MSSKSTIQLSIAIAVCLFSWQGQGANYAKQYHPVAPYTPVPVTTPMPITPTTPKPADTCPICDQLTAGFEANQNNFTELIMNLKNATEKVAICNNPVSSQVMTVMRRSRTAAGARANARCPDNYVVLDCRCSTADRTVCDGVFVDQSGQRCRAVKDANNAVDRIWAIATCVPNDGKIVVKTTVRDLDPMRGCNNGDKIIKCLLENRSDTDGATVEIDTASQECSMSTACVGGDCGLTVICETM